MQIPVSQSVPRLDGRGWEDLGRSWKGNNQPTQCHEARRGKCQGTLDIRVSRKPSKPSPPLRPWLVVAAASKSALHAKQVIGRKNLPLCLLAARCRDGFITRCYDLLSKIYKTDGSAMPICPYAERGTLSRSRTYNKGK